MGAELLLPTPTSGCIGSERRYDYQRWLARSNNNSEGATIYITASPCIECAKLIIQAGIKRVVYGEQYRLTDGVDLLKRAGIETIYINPDEDE